MNTPNAYNGPCFQMFNLLRCRQERERERRREREAGGDMLCCKGFFFRLRRPYIKRGNGKIRLDLCTCTSYYGDYWLRGIFVRFGNDRHQWSAREKKGSMVWGRNLQKWNNVTTTKASGKLLAA